MSKDKQEIATIDLALQEIIEMLKSNYYDLRNLLMYFIEIDKEKDPKERIKLFKIRWYNEKSYLERELNIDGYKSRYETIKWMLSNLKEPEKDKDNDFDCDLENEGEFE